MKEIWQLAWFWVPVHGPSLRTMPRFGGPATRCLHSLSLSHQKQSGVVMAMSIFIQFCRSSLRSSWPEFLGRVTFDPI